MSEGNSKITMLLLEEQNPLVEDWEAAAVAGLDHLQGRLGQKVCRFVLSGGET